MAALDRFLKATGDAEIAWLSDGVDTGRGAEFLEGLGKTIGDRKLTVFEGGAAPAQALVAAENAAAKMTVKVLRTTGGIAAGVVRAIDAKGSPIGEARYAFGTQDRETEAAFDLPVELRNDIARLEISGERSAGAVQLLDKRWRRRAIGVVTGATSDTAQPLLASTFYLTRALSPFADVRLGDRGAPQQVIAQFLDQRLPMIVLADVGTLSPEIRERLNAWIDQGGVLVRFAGPRLAQADDDLVPVKLRRGGRILGGSLTWEKPQHLASFAADGPFAGLAVPKDITVNRQVLAEPDAVLATKSWASLEDGTPLVTGEHRGKGIVSLFHVGADCAGRTCRCPAASSRCCGGWSTCPATPRSPARALRARRPMSRPWRRCARSTASARSDRRPRPPSRCRRIIATARRRIIRRASTARPMARSRSTRWPRPIASRRSIHLRCARSAPATPTPNRAICAAFCCRRRWRCS